MIRLVPVLSVDPAPGGLRFRLEVPERDRGEPLQEEHRQAVDPGTLRSLQDTAGALLRSPEHPRFRDAARTRGALLYRTLVPPRLGAQLKTVEGPLLVSTSVYGVPWEVLHDGEEFWGLRYALGKRLVMERALPAVGQVPAGHRRRALVVGADPHGDLPFVRDEMEAVCDALEAVADVECWSGRLATFDAVTAALAGGFDLIHFAGHVVTGEGASPALLLGDGNTLAAAAIEQNVRGRPLVFLNGCASARGETAPQPDGWEATVSSLAYAFLFGGALGVVGTLSDVADRHAAALAIAFYRRALGDAPVGEALRAARVETRADRTTAGSPTWLSVVLYGNPAQVVVQPAPPVYVVPPPAPPAPAPARVPGEPLRRRSRVRWPALGVLLVVFVAAVLHWRTPPPAEPVVVGVMAVRSRSPQSPAWMREITRDGLNTILSRFDGLRVYSRQKIDFVREKRSLSEIEAAEALGMRKMLSATVDTDGQVVTLGLEVVDIPTGLLQGSEQVQGPQDHFMELQTEFAVRTLAALGVHTTPAEIQTIAASRTNDTLRAYRMLSDSLGDPVAGGAVPAAPAPPGTSWLGCSALAFAEAADADETAIRDLIDRWAASLEAKKLDDLAGLQIEMSAGQRVSLQRYFDNAGNLRVRVHDLDVTVEGTEALATFTREDVFVDGVTGREMRLEVRINGMLVKEGGQWKIRGLRTPS